MYFFQQAAATDENTKRKRNTPRGCSQSSQNSPTAEEEEDGHRRKAPRPHAAGPSKVQHGDGGEGRARTSRCVLRQLCAWHPQALGLLFSLLPPYTHDDGRRAGIAASAGTRSAASGSPGCTRRAGNTSTWGITRLRRAQPRRTTPLCNASSAQTASSTSAAVVVVCALCVSHRYSLSVLCSVALSISGGSLCLSHRVSSGAAENKGEKAQGGGSRRTQQANSAAQLKAANREPFAELTNLEAR